MSPQELHNMIQKIKELPDNLLLRIMKIAWNELLTRTAKTLVELREGIDKGKHETRNTRSP